MAGARLVADEAAGRAAHQLGRQLHELRLRAERRITLPYPTLGAGCPETEGWGLDAQRVWALTGVWK